MKVIVLALMVFVLASIGFGQSTMTERELKALNAKAKWVKVNENAETGEPIFIDHNSIGREDMLVFFRVKLVRELSGNTYVVVAGSCATANYRFNNIFYEMPNGKFSSFGTAQESDVLEAKRGDMMYSAIYYACNKPANPK